LVVEEIGILRILEEELLLVDAGLVEAVGCEELEDVGVVVVHWEVIVSYLLKSVILTL